MRENYVYTTRITGCSACGKDHHVVLVPLDESEVLWDGVEYTHMTVCPETGEEVYAHLYGDDADADEGDEDDDEGTFTGYLN